MLLELCADAVVHDVVELGQDGRAIERRRGVEGGALSQALERELADVEELSLGGIRRFESSYHGIERGVLGLRLRDFAKRLEAPLRRASASRGELCVAEKRFPRRGPTLEGNLEGVALAFDRSVLR